MKDLYFRKKRICLWDHFNLGVNGFDREEQFETLDLATAITQPVTWYGESGRLHFWNYSLEVPVNQTASALILHPGFTIRGPAVVTTGYSYWHYARVAGSVDETQSALSHLGFKDMVLFHPAGRSQMRTTIYAKDRDDFFAIKMAL